MKEEITDMKNENNIISETNRLFPSNWDMTRSFTTFTFHKLIEIVPSIRFYQPLLDLKYTGLFFNDVI